MGDSPHASMKQCSTCKELFSATPEFFSRNKSMKDGLVSYCKTCERAYRKAHQGQATERMRQYRQTEKNKTYRKEWQAQHYHQHREELLEIRRQYYVDHHEERLEYSRQHRKSHPDLYSGIDRAHKHKRKARKLAAGGSYTPQQLQEQYQRQKGKCYYCKTKVGKVWHADHVIPLNRGGSNDIHNIVIACPTCNMKKHAKLPHEWPQGNRLL